MAPYTNTAQVNDTTDNQSTTIAFMPPVLADSYWVVLTQAHLAIEIAIKQNLFVCRLCLGYHHELSMGGTCTLLHNASIGDRTKWYMDKMVSTKWYNVIFCVHFNSVEFNIYLVTKSQK